MTLHTDVNRTLALYIYIYIYIYIFSLTTDKLYNKAIYVF